MGRKRTPLAKAAVTGQADRRPGRYADRSEPDTGGLGEAPEWLTPEQTEAYDDLRGCWPWLMESDRFLIILGAKLLAEMRADKENAMPAPRMAQFRMIISACGGTPSDRSKVSAPEKPDDDPASAFIN